MKVSRSLAPAALLTLAAVLVSSPSFSLPIEHQTLAVTYNFTGSGGGGAGTPIAATTDFINGLWNPNVGGDKLATATHELTHGIGFAVAYNNLNAKLYGTPGAGAGPIPAGSRVYSTDGTVGGILMVLTPSSQGTHADPNATGAAPWPATGVNQANDIMQPTLVIGSTLGAQDAAVLNDAFGWAAGGGINVTLNIQNPWKFTAAELAAFNGAKAAVEALFGQAAAPNFTWTINQIPEPRTFLLVATGLGLLAAVRRRPH